MAAQPALGAIVVGTGFGVLTHLRALRAAGFEVHALVGRDPARTEDRARRAGVPLGTTSLERALALPGVDVVSIATPPHSHARIAIAAARAGKHVMCENPFARDAREARDMLEAVEKAGVVHLMGFEFRFSTAQALATRAIRTGAIGEPRLATFALQIPGLADPKAGVPEWWSDEKQGGGWLGAFASHVVDQVRGMFGELEGVSATLTNVAERAWSAEDSFTVHFRTQSGVAGVMQSSGAVYGPPLGMTRIAGTRGTLWIEGDDVHVADAAGQCKLEVPEDLLNPAPHPPDREFLHSHYDMLHSGGIDLGPFSKLFGVMRDRIRGLPVADDPRAASFADGLASQIALDAIRRAARERVWVAIESASGG